MRIEIDYRSSSGNIEQIGYALKELLIDYDCRLADMDLNEPSLDSDIYLVGFGVRKNACPFSTLEWIEQLEGKTILLFCTSALHSIKGYQQRIEAQIMPFLPEDCDYRGLVICPAKMTKEELTYLEGQMIQNGKQENIAQLHRMYEESLSHPDRKDLLAVQEFILERLKLNYGY